MNPARRRRGCAGATREADVEAPSEAYVERHLCASQWARGSVEAHRAGDGDGDKGDARERTRDLKSKPELDWFFRFSSRAELRIIFIWKWYYPLDLIGRFWSKVHLSGAKKTAPEDRFHPSPVSILVNWFLSAMMWSCDFWDSLQQEKQEGRRKWSHKSGGAA